jgi:hypothetical protein
MTARVLVSSDCNARTLCKHDYNTMYYMINLCPTSNPMVIVFLHPCKDFQCNESIDICKATSFRIVNNRLGGNFVKDIFTCYNYNDTRLIDYFLLCENDFEMINNFHVCNFNAFR